MLKKQLLFLFAYIMVCTVFGQKNTIILSGKITDSISVVKNANIINLNTKQGTSSADDGSFKITVFKGDTIQISTIQHAVVKVRIQEKHFKNRAINIQLQSTTYVLDAFDLKKHNLVGRLGIDLKQVPKNKRDSLLKNTMDFSNVNMKRAEADDYIDKRVRPQIAETDPTAKFVGAGAAAAIPFKYSERLWALRKKLARKKAFPTKILNELGEDFFFDALKIPVDNYFHFLEYCNPLGIEELHKEDKILKLIKIFKKESTSYLKIIKKM